MTIKNIDDPIQRKLFEQKVVEMPDGYYYGDKPNPNLRSFIKEHLRKHPYDPLSDNYNVAAFDKPIESTKATAIYNMHTYWSKKPHGAIRQYIQHYTSEEELVLDPFSGSGGTALAALMEGRKAIAIDLSPAASFITKNYCTPVDVNKLQNAFEDLKKTVKSEISWLYETRCDRCGGKASTLYTVYSHIFQCPRCLEKVPLFDCIDALGTTSKGKPKKIKSCPHCHKRGIVEEISTRQKRFEAVPVLVSYVCQNGCKPERLERQHNDSDNKKREYFKKYDLGKIKEIESKDIPHWYPTHRMMHAPDNQKRWGVKWRAGTSNFRTVDELFTKRNLWALATFREAIDQSIYRDLLLFAFTGICLGFSRMCQWIPGASYPFPMMRGTYYMPQIFKEQLVPHYYENRIKLIIRAAKDIDIKSDCCVSTEDVCNMSGIKANSIDYIFTDPPYADNVQYGELNFIWEAWLNFDTKWHDKEIIVNDVRGKTETDWANMMRQAIVECYRVLKPGRWLSLCFHHTDPHIWELTQDIMAEVGFLVDKSDSALFIDTDQKSYNQIIADKVSKRDLVINFRKPKKGEVVSDVKIDGEENRRTFNEKVHTIIRDYLSSYPGVTKDRVYDEVISHMVRSGQMEAHNFEELLNQVADEVKQPIMKDLFIPEDPNLFGTHEISRWYLKEVESVKVDEAESSKEDAAADRIIRFIKKYIKDNPHQDGVHYSDLFEYYVYSVKDKPRRPLAEWLLDYFYKTESGTYRVPVSDEEEKLKTDGRAKGINRRVKRYIAYLEQGVTVPERIIPNDATLVEWIRHCKRSGLFEQGKQLFEKGGLNLDNLPEEEMVNVEEDYQVCVRMIEKSVSLSAGKTKRGRTKKK